MIVCGDASDVSLWPDDFILLTDPPYGLGKSWRKSWHGNNGNSTLRDGMVPEWDSRVVDFKLLESLVSRASVSVVWGGNYYPFPPTPAWFVWDKLQYNRGSDAEMAWTNSKVPGVKVFRMSRIDAYFNKRRFVKEHVAEKPVQLMAWCLQQLKVKSGVVFDPFCGSGNAGIAAAECGFDFVGIDINQHWVDVARKRAIKSSGGEGR